MTRTGSTTSDGSADAAASLATSVTTAALASIPVFTPATAKSSSTVWIWRRTKDGSRATTPRTSVVFCAVTAVSALVPWTPWAAKVFRSACTPAPPPESEPAIVNAVRGVSLSGTGQP